MKVCLQGAKKKGAQRNVAKMSNTKKDKAIANKMNCTSLYNSIS